MPIAMFQSPDSHALYQMPGDTTDVRFINNEAVVEDEVAIAEMRKHVAAGQLGVKEISSDDLAAKAEAAAAHAEALRQLAAAATPMAGSAKVGVGTTTSMGAVAGSSEKAASSIASVREKLANEAAKAGAASE